MSQPNSLFILQNERLKTEVEELESKFMETRRDLDIALQQATRVEEQLIVQKNMAKRVAEENQKKIGKIAYIMVHQDS